MSRENINRAFHVNYLKRQLYDRTGLSCHAPVTCYERTNYNYSYPKGTTINIGVILLPNWVILQNTSVIPGLLCIILSDSVTIDDSITTVEVNRYLLKPMIIEKHIKTCHEVVIFEQLRIRLIQRNYKRILDRV